MCLGGASVREAVKHVGVEVKYSWIHVLVNSLATHGILGKFINFSYVIYLFIKQG